MPKDFSFKFQNWWDSEGSFMDQEELEELCKAAYKQSLQDALDLFELQDPYSRNLELIINRLKTET